MQTVPLHAPSSAVDVQVCALHTLHLVQGPNTNLILKDYHCIQRNRVPFLLSCRKGVSGTAAAIHSV